MNTIHRIAISKTKSCYFLIRAFGNFLVFADKIDRLPKEEFKAFGGLSKMFLEYPSSVNEVHSKLFNIFGSHAVVHNNNKNALLPLDEYNIDFYDHTIQYMAKGEKRFFIAKQNRKKIMILGQSFYLNKDAMIESPHKNDIQFIEDKIHSHDIDLIFFTHHHKKHNHLKVKNQHLLHKLIEQLDKGKFWK